MRNITLYILLILVSGCSSENYQAQFNSLLDNEWERMIDDNPVYASSMGDLTNNTEWSDTSIDKIYANHQIELQILSQLEEFDIKNFTEENKVNYFLFRNRSNSFSLLWMRI